MAAVRRMAHAIGIAAMLALAGCAQAYHDYPCGCVPYAYCAPPPRPYVAYRNCGCPTPIAAQPLVSLRAPSTGNLEAAQRIPARPVAALDGQPDDGL
jgi:hypothetical protein